jgi:hypothetical protein
VLLLPRLTYLSIARCRRINFHSLMTVPAAARGRARGAFPPLQELNVRDCPLLCDAVSDVRFVFL